MIFDPFKNEIVTGKGNDAKKRAFLVGTAPGRVHLLVKMALYRGQSINCYHLIRGGRVKLEGRNMANFEQIRDKYIDNGIEVRYPNDIPETDVERWVEFGKEQARAKGLQVAE